MCICSLRYPACNAHAPYCHLRPARLYNIIFFQYLMKGIFLLSDLNGAWIISIVFRIIVKHQISWKSFSGNRWFRGTDGQTDMTKLIIAFRNFAIAPENVYILRSINRQIACCVYRYRRWLYLCQIYVVCCINIPSECCLKANVEWSIVRIGELCKTRKQTLFTCWVPVYWNVLNTCTSPYLSSFHSDNF